MRRALPRLPRTLCASVTPRLPARPLPRPLAVPAPSRTYVTEKLSMAEKLRRKLWGTDAPPGSTDPYTKKPVAEGQTGVADTIDRSGYVEATDGRGLPIAGLEEPLGVWEIDSFAPLEPVRDTEAVHRALHRAVVETYTLHLNGTDPAEFFSIDTPVTEDRASERVNVAVAEDGEVRFEFLGPEVESAILSSLEPVKKAEPEPVEESVAETAAAPAETEAAPAEAAEVVAEAGAVAETPEAVSEVQEEAAAPEVEQLSRPQWLEQGLQGEGWVKLPLRQDALKFAIVKRVLQLTGQKVPDTVASQATTVADILKPLITKPAPKKLAEALLNSELAELPNVKIFASKVRPLDKERTIGRARPYEQVTDYKYEGIDEPLPVFKGHVTYR